MKKYTTMPLAVIGVALVTSCGGSSGSGSTGSPSPDTESDDGFVIQGEPTVGGSFDFLGFVDIIDDTLEDRINHDSNFFAMRQSTSTSDFNTIPPAAGQCRLRITDTIPADSAAIGFPTQPFDLASAGESMTLTSSAGTYATIAFTESRFDIGAYPAPDELTLDLPGSDFPAFNNVTITPLSLPTDFSASTGRSLTSETVYSWTPGSAADNALYLSGTSFSGGSFINLECQLVDDGEFTLPDTVDQALVNALGAGYSLDDIGLDRRAVTIVTQGNALLVVTRRQQSL